MVLSYSRINIYYFPHPQGKIVISSVKFASVSFISTSAKRGSVHILKQERLRGARQKGQAGGCRLRLVIAFVRFFTRRSTHGCLPYQSLAARLCHLAPKSPNRRRALESLKPLTTYFLPILVITNRKFFSCRTEKSTICHRHSSSTVGLSRCSRE